MKMIRQMSVAAIASLIMITSYACPVVAQVSPQPKPTSSVPAGKVAIINTEVFADVKTGITRLVSALTTVDREFKPRRDEIQVLKTRYDQLVKEIDTTKPVADQKSLSAKTDQAELLKPR